MVIKSKRSNISTSIPTTMLSKPSLSLKIFPTELLLITFQNLDIPTLLKICNVCKRFLQIGTMVLSKKFKDPNIGLMLTFEQEHKWRFNVQFEFSKFNEQNGNFIFKPIKLQSTMRFIHSSVVRNPVLSKVAITGIKCSNNDGKVCNEIRVPFSPTNVTNQNNHLTTLPQPPASLSSPSPTPSNPTIKSQKLEENFLQKSLPLGIKSHKDVLKKTQHVYRMGHGTTHLRIPYTFSYSVADKPPPPMQKTRGGERWLTPLNFECSPSFFYPHEPTAHKIIMTIIHLRKKNLLKKKPLSSTQISNNNYKQKQKAIGTEIEEGFISIDIDTGYHEIQNPKAYKLFFEKQMNLQDKLKPSRRWVRGARH
ncbi:14898_t:CDS:1 [Funneliformis geosporum]|uniref:14898_t:CDS:1 n=1 Tax=Funneliformis geosporum TaxID=1117311 RepID=A0A9W4WWX6_9GLOM|nr:14898_t:CDS:1 [Funneliformis geosporum]